MHAELPESEAQIEGLLMIAADSPENGRQQLEISTQLRIQQIYPAETIAQNGFVLNRNPRHRWQHVNQTDGTKLTIDATGRTVVHQDSLALPYDLGSLTSLMFPGPPNETTTVTKNDDGSHTVSQAAFNTGGAAGQGITTSVFDQHTGGLMSVKTDLTLTFETENEVREVPVRISFLKLNDAEQTDWLASHGTATARKNLPPFQPSQENELLTDLAANRRILHWLTELDRRDPKRFSDAVVDAVAILATHENPSIRTLAARIVEQIPEKQLNPFREVEVSPPPPPGAA